MIEKIIIGILMIGFVFIVWKIQKENKSLKEEIKQTQFKLKSAYVKFGKTFEHFAPFTKKFPGDREKFVFLGCPIDGIIFDNDKIKFIEIKTGSSQLSNKQLKIKSQVEKGLVEFKEVRY